MNVPVIVSIFDEKLHNLGTTVVDYDQLEFLLSKIKGICQKNKWTHSSYVPPTLEVFINTLQTKDAFRDV